MISLFGHLRVSIACQCEAFGWLMEEMIWRNWKDVGKC
jgi:hypothetical protein